MTADQESFLDRAVAMIGQEGLVTPVRLALFVELIKARPWTTATLGGLGGTVGIGVRFLDETFVEEGAPPEHRLHAEAARRVLAALLPGPGADIKGHVRSAHELLDAAGYRDNTPRFESLMRILDAETRLLTPVIPAGLEEALDGGAGRIGHQNARGAEVLSAHARLPGPVDPRMAGAPAEGDPTRSGRAAPG